jgi:integrase
MATVRFTEAWVRNLPPGSGQFVDQSLPGFMLVSGRQRVSWYVQATVRGGRQTKYRVGHWPEVPQVEARRLAADVLAAMRRGLDPREAERAKKARSTTLEEALEAHLAGRNRSPRTEENYRYALTQYLGDWRHRSVEEIGRDRAGVRARHQRITTDHGLATADSVMRVLRAVYNRARREHPELPPNPCENVDYHGGRRRQVDLAPERLRAWGRAVLGIRPVRRDLQLFMILSGMRRSSACEARIEHVDFERGCLRVPSPKGGEARAFDLPLSPPLVDLLRARVGERTNGWIFQSNRNGGPIREVRDEELGGLVGHALRHCYASVSIEAGVGFAELKVLLNHSVSGMGVTGGYLHLGLRHLQDTQARASAAVLDRLGLDHAPGSWPPLARSDDRHGFSEPPRSASLASTASSSRVRSATASATVGNLL